ncbi:stage II sporulation protein E [Leptospira ryugenii]|uniref:Stage II sporulation protein E n=1 Tax=Leptospira ryugenii TaxID=1917863 RepID=A0A2P2DXM1_9LEPT|nr:SpoIIE family protein phosphatase [Leptospira ryugenii]GBF49372.1 stage II sporulation protein E [Leptospira ryugenii]
MRRVQFVKRIFLLFLILPLLLSCETWEDLESEEILFRKGTMDLSKVPFGEDTVVPFQGDCELYFNELHYPPFHGEKSLTAYLNFQESWQGQEVSGKELPRLAHVTIRCFLIVNKETVGQELRFYVPDVASAYRVFANGVLLGGQGKPGINRFDEVPKIQAKYYTLIPDSENIEIVFHISNYQNNFGGFWDKPSIGNKFALDRQRLISTARDLFLLGAVLIIGFYHSGLYFYRRKEKSIFYFAILCFLLGLRIACTGNRFIFDLLPDLSWQIAFRLEFLSYYLAIPVSILFIGNLFPLDANHRLIRWILYSSFFYVLTLVLPVSIYTILLFGFQLIAFVTILAVIHVNLGAVRNRRPNARLFFAGLCVLATCVASDIIRHSLNSRGISLTPYGLLVFIFFQSLILSSRIASAFTRAEELAESLKISNESLVALTENLESIVTDRTSQLNSTLQRLKKDLQLAKKIQQKILPAPDIQYPSLSYQLHFEPQDDVGGDFYDVFELDTGITRIFLADATGHGIQAALYTMAIKSEYEAIKKFVTKTDDLIGHLNQKIQNKFSGLKIVFTCFLVDIDTRLSKLYYTSAGHPDQILDSKQNGTQLLTRTGNIIGLKKEQEYSQKIIPFQKGDRLFLFTDGIVEQKNTNREEFGLERVMDLMAKNIASTTDNTMKDITSALTNFRGANAQEDDTTLLLFEHL